MDMAAELAKQAVGELSFEIDTEIVNMLDTAVAAGTRTGYTWSRTLPIGVSKRDHFAGFGEVIESARTGVYAVTKKHMPNVILVAPDVIPVLNFVPGYTASGREVDFAGPFQCGTYNGMKVFCSPNLAEGTWDVIVNKGALEATAGVFGTYMPVVPTAILQGPDGGTSQGWSTLYDAKMLNDALVSGGKVVA